MTYSSWQGPLQQELGEIRSSGLWKSEREIASAQSAHITVEGRDLINMCANNYLGLANHPEVVAAAHQALDDYGFGTASVRFICGTQDIHKELEQKIKIFEEIEKLSLSNKKLSDKIKENEVNLTKLNKNIHRIYNDQTTVKAFENFLINIYG